MSQVLSQTAHQAAMLSDSIPALCTSTGISIPAANKAESTIPKFPGDSLYCQYHYTTKISLE